MAKTDYYTFRKGTEENHVICQAVDHDYNPTKTYNIHNSTCDCWAGHKWCRHKQMLVKFRKENKVDSNEFWSHDKSVWLSKATGDAE
jgi:hypothetical protein